MPEPSFWLKDPARLTRAAPYLLAPSSALLTTIAAGTATAGHLFVARYHTTDSKKFHVTRLRVAWQTIAGFTAAQEVSLAAYKLTGYTVAHTGGTAVTPLKRVPNLAASNLAARIGDTGALTAGTHTIAEQILHGSFSELAALSTVPKGFIDEQVGGDDDPWPVLVLSSDEGILVRNEVIGGAGGTGRLTVYLDGYEKAAA